MLPNHLQNRKFETIDDLIETVFFTFSGDYDFKEPMIEEIIKNNGHLRLTKQSIARSLEKFEIKYNQHKENNKKKIQNSQDFRHLVKNTNFYKMSKSQGIIALVAMCSDILTFTNQFALKNIITSDVIEELWSTIFEKNHLKIEFSEVARRFFEYFDESSQFKQYDLIPLYLEKHGQYLYAHLLEDETSTNRIKEDIVELLNKNINEISDLLNEKMEKDPMMITEEKIEMKLSDKDIENYRNLELSALPHEQLTAYEHAFIENEFNQKIAEYSQLLEKIRPTLKRYFDIDGTTDFDRCNEYISHIKHPYKVYYVNKNPIHITHLLTTYMQNNITELAKYENLSFTDDEDLKEITKTTHTLIFDILHLLAYYLRKDLKLWLDLNDLFHEEECCQQHYDTLRDRVGQSFLNLSPSDIYENIRIVAVLMEIDNIKIQKRIKSILMKEYAYIHNNLKDYNQPNMHSNVENAITFLFDYMIDPIFIASYSPFILQMTDLLKIPMISQDDSIMNEIVEALNSKDDCDKDIHDAIAMYNHFINQAKKANDSSIFGVAKDKIKETFIAVYERSHLPMELENFFDMVDTYQQNIIAYFCHFIFKDQAKQFTSLSIEKQILEVYELCFQFYLLEQLYSCIDYIPTLEAITTTHKIETLTEDNNKWVQILQKKDREMASYNEQLKNVKDQFDQALFKEQANLNNIHQNEIKELSKQLKTKDKEIRHLKENQAELFKLRELMFNLQNEQEMIEEENEIDLTSIIQNKKIVFVGGHVKMLERLRAKYPNIKIINNVNTTSTQIIHSADHVFIFFNHISHSLYYKVMSILENAHHVLWDYISYRNIEKVENEIYEKLMLKKD